MKNPALRSSNEYSISSGISTGLTANGTGGGAGVMAVCIGNDTVEGVVGTGISMAFGVLFSSSATVFVFEGVLKERSFIGGSVLFNVSSSASSNMLDFEETVEEMGEKGCRSIGD
ncbi:hypothetical protein OIU84_007456 [Salix udensis]|uniref:Uncharacterized protein n=1 Tax=Salix udensis TaxID=889485 RepID=A0AAD6JT34_9ROSI|nr:hypothetical protein OIU84_007456 [Salix udensis]